MDTSEQYIKMRLAAIPDLGIGDLPNPDYNDIGFNDVYIDSKGDWYYFTETKYCQLECQDQLQKMIDYDMLQRWGRGGEYLITTLIEKFSKFVSGPRFPHFNSLEQLWLAFVMMTLYHKGWYNDEWRLKDDRNTQLGVENE